MLFLLMNLYVPIGILFDPKRYYKDGSHTKIAEAKAAAAGTHKDDEAVPAAEVVAEDIPAPAQAPPPATQPRTMSQRIERLEEEVCEIHMMLDEQREVMDTMAGDLSRFTTWQQMINMDDPNITMEEYIRLEEEKARRRGKVYNWETATYGKI
nr:hypothetical protein [Tanacetum cinerariifolium]